MDALRCLHSEMSSWALESTGCTKELQLPRNRSVFVFVCVCVSVGGWCADVSDRERKGCKVWKECYKLCVVVWMCIMLNERKNRNVEKK